VDRIFRSTEKWHKKVLKLKNTNFDQLKFDLTTLSLKNNLSFSKLDAIFGLFSAKNSKYLKLFKRYSFVLPPAPFSAWPGGQVEGGWCLVPVNLIFVSCDHPEIVSASI
jgi:hypothetical protein